MKDTKIKRNRPLVFICSPFAGDVNRNVSNARHYCRFALDAGVIPFAPHLLFPQFMNDSDMAERELGLSFGLAFMSKCDEVWVFGSSPSPGMRLEIEKARECGIAIRYFSEHCTEVKG